MRVSGTSSRRKGAVHAMQAQFFRPPPPHTHTRFHVSALPQAAAQERAAPAAPVIAIPRVRDVADYESGNLKALRAVPRYAALDPTTAPYFRNQDMWVRQTVAQVLADYDMDELDQAFLSKLQAKVRCACVCVGGGD